MEDKIKHAYLYDFYGELLNAHQRQIFEDFVLNDLSLGEIAQEEGITRQGVHDMVKRCVKALEGYEAKLHLLDKFLKIKEQILQIQDLTTDSTKAENGQVLQDIRQISNDILEEL